MKETIARPPSPNDETVVLRRIEPERNMARFYVLTLEPTLFGEVAVMRHWGRLGTRGRRKSCFLGSPEAASAALCKQAARSGAGDMKRHPGRLDRDRPSRPHHRQRGPVPSGLPKAGDCL